MMGILDCMQRQEVGQESSQVLMYSLDLLLFEQRWDKQKHRTQKKGTWIFSVLEKNRDTHNIHCFLLRLLL